MSKLTGTKTEKNLMDAFAGESQARNRYTYYTSVAKKEGYVQVSKFFEETANNEKEHAEIWFKLLDGISDTKANLAAAAAGEHGEWASMYPNMAKDAREEGFNDIADLFDGVAKIEKEHEERYQKLLSNIEENVVFNKDVETEWKCSNCGHIHIGKDAPDVCPICEHPKAYFEVNARNY